MTVSSLQRAMSLRSFRAAQFAKVYVSVRKHTHALLRNKHEHTHLAHICCADRTVGIRCCVVSRVSLVPLCQGHLKNHQAYSEPSHKFDYYDAQTFCVYRFVRCAEIFHCISDRQTAKPPRRDELLHSFNFHYRICATLCIISLHHAHPSDKPN